VAYFGLLLFTAILFIRPQEWVQGMMGWPILDYVAGFALVAWLGYLISSDWKMRDAPQNFLMLGLLVAVVMSHVRHTYLWGLIESFQSFSKVVLMYFLVASTLNSPRRIRGFFLVMVLGCLFMSTHGILQAHTGIGFGVGELSEPMLQPVEPGAGEFMPLGTEQGIMRVRAFGIFHDPNDLSLMLVAVMPFLIVKLLDREAPAFMRLMALLPLPLMVYCVYLTNSRGGWLALLVIVVVYAFTHVRKKSLGIVLALGLIPAVFFLGPSRVGTISTEEVTARSRFASWGYGNTLLKSNPFFGTGMGRFTEDSPEGQVAHNSFVHCWGELGMFGYFFFFGLVFASFKDAWALGGVDPEDNPTQRELSRMGTAGVASLAGFLAAGFFLTRTYIMPLYMLFAACAALRTVYEKQDNKLDKSFGFGDWKFVLIGAAASPPAIWLLIRIVNL
jgi:hypothetical protein